MFNRQLISLAAAACALQSGVSAIVTVDTSNLTQTTALASCLNASNCEVNIHPNGKDWSADIMNGTGSLALGKRGAVPAYTGTVVGSAGVYIGQLDPQTLINSPWLPCNINGCDPTNPSTVNNVGYVVDNGWTSPYQTGTVTVTSSGFYQGYDQRDALEKVVGAALQTTGCVTETVRENCNRREDTCSKVYQVNTCMAPAYIQVTSYLADGSASGQMTIQSVFTQSTSQDFLCSSVISGIVSAVSALSGEVGTVLGALDAAECA